MIIEVDLNKIKELNITPNQFIFIKSIQNPSNGKIKSFTTSFIKENEVIDLINKGFLTENSNITKAELTDYFIDVYTGEFKEDFFQVFYELYPVSVVRPDGLKDYLRTDINRCKKLYKQIVGSSRDKHDNLIKCLLYEIQQKQRNNKMSYFKKMRTWLVSEQWLEAEEAMKDVKTTLKVTLYGTDIV